MKENSTKHLEEQMCIARERLENALLAGADFEEYYVLSLDMDRLLEEYMEQEQEKYTK